MNPFTFELFLLRPVALPPGTPIVPFLSVISGSYAQQVREKHGNRLQFGENLLLVPIGFDGSCFLGACGGGSIPAIKAAAKWVAEKWKVAQRGVETTIRRAIRQPPPATIAPRIDGDGDDGTAAPAPTAPPSPPGAQYTFYSPTNSSRCGPGVPTNQVVRVPFGKSPLDYGCSGAWVGLGSGYIGPYYVLG